MKTSVYSCEYESIYIDWLFSRPHFPGFIPGLTPLLEVHVFKFASFRSVYCVVGIVIIGHGSVCLCLNQQVKLYILFFIEYIGRFK